MIVIYEQDDKIDPAIEARTDHLGSLENIQEDLRSASYGAYTAYVARSDGRYQMIKNRNAPLEHEPVTIAFGDSLPEYEA